MEKIRIGKGPDFCLTRGKESLNYRLKMSGIINSNEWLAPQVVDRRLAMVIRMMSHTFPISLKGFSMKLEIVRSQNILSFQFCKEFHNHQFCARLLLPYGLSDSQLTNITKVFSESIQSLL